MTVVLLFVNGRTNSIMRFVLCALCCIVSTGPRTACAQYVCSFSSIEWLLADADIVVRGEIVAALNLTDSEATSGKLVTVKVRESLKGAKASRATFTTQDFGRSGTLEEWKQRHTQLLCFLKRKPRGRSLGDVQSHERDPEHRGGDLYAIGSGTGMLPLVGMSSAERQSIGAIFTLELKALTGRSDVMNAARAAAAYRESNEPPRAYQMFLPGSIASLAGHRGDGNVLDVPIDRRLETLALHLIRSPGDFFPCDDARGHGIARDSETYLLREEGVKALKYFKSDKNAAVLKSLLGDPGFHFVDGKRVYGVRKNAREVLACWDADVEAAD